MSLPLTIDELKKLQQKKYRDQYRYFLAEGEHLVIELGKAVRHNPALAASEVFVSTDYAADKPLGDWARSFPVHRLSNRQMSALSDTQHPQGIVAVVPISAPRAAAADDKIIYLHEIQDPGNLGSILRTLAWFGGFRCVLSPNSVDPHNPKVVRASMGAIFHVPMEIEVSAESLLSRCTRLAMLDLDGQPLSAAGFRNFDGYVFGSEARGLPEILLSRLRESTYCIPGSRLIDSLNLAAAVNICAYELRRADAVQPTQPHEQSPR